MHCWHMQSLPSLAQLHCILFNEYSYVIMLNDWILDSWDVNKTWLNVQWLRNVTCGTPNQASLLWYTRVITQNVTSALNPNFLSDTTADSWQSNARSPVSGTTQPVVHSWSASIIQVQYRRAILARLAFVAFHCWPVKPCGRIRDTLDLYWNHGILQLAAGDCARFVRLTIELRSSNRLISD